MFSLAFKNLAHRRRRSALTILGIALGTTLILTLMLLGSGMERAVSERMASFGSDLIVVTPGKESEIFSSFGGKAKIRDRDVSAVRSVEGVRLVAPASMTSFKVDYRGEAKSSIVMGTPWAESKILFGESQGFTISEGRWPDREEANEVVLGALVANKTFRQQVRLNDGVEIRGRRFVVAGIFKPTGDTGDDSGIYVSFEQLRRMTGGTGASMVYVKSAAGYEPSAVAAAIRAKLSRQPGIGDFTVMTSTEAVNLIGDILGIIGIVLGSIAAVALVVGGVGVMNTMFTAVMERTREIGVYKAIGATDRQVLSIFLTEAALLGALGGVIGAVVAWGLAKAAELAARAAGSAALSVAFEPVTFVLVVLFSAGLGTLFGAMPAWQAARLRPTEALKYE